MQWRKFIHTWWSVLPGALILILPALANHYPLVYSDTGAYIYSGFNGTVPADRPLTYGLFLRHSSLAASLWLTVFTQALIVAALIRQFMFYMSLNSTGRYLLVMAILGGVSSLPWFTSMLMADVFAGVSFFLFFILLFFPPHRAWSYILMAVLWIISDSTHLTFGPATIFMFTVLALMRLNMSWRPYLPSYPAMRAGLVVLLCSFLFLPVLHGLFGGGFERSRGGHLHLLSRNVENGSLKYYLDNHCSDQTAFMCKYKDSLPATAPEFLWLPSSPLYKLGGWEANAEDYKQLNKALFLDGHCLNLMVQYYFKTLQHHVAEHLVGEEFISFDVHTPPGWEIEAHFNKELPTFLNSRQAQGLWGTFFKPWNKMHEWILMLSIAVTLIIYALMQRPHWFNPFQIGKVKPLRKLPLYPELYMSWPLFLSFGLYYTGNMLAVAIASSGSRYNSRLDWIWVLLAVVTVMRVIKSKLWR